MVIRSCSTAPPRAELQCCSRGDEYFSNTIELLFITFPALICTMYTPPGNSTECSPAAISPSTSVATSLLRTSKTFSLTCERCGSEKRIVVLGLNGLG